MVTGRRLVGAVPSNLLPRCRPKSVATSRPLHLDAVPSHHRSVRTTWHRAQEYHGRKGLGEGIEREESLDDSQRMTLLFASQV